MPYPHTADATDVLDAVRGFADQDLPFYTESVSRAFADCDPVFTRPGYAQFFWHCASTVPGWLAKVVLSNAEAESHGSAKLLALWERVEYDEHVERQILVHGRDESRHSRLFLELTELVFQDLVDPGFVDVLRTSLPDIRGVEYHKVGRPLDESALIDALVQMNIGEIRTRVHLQMFAPVLYALAPPEHQQSVERILRGLARDEIRHIGYTAALLESWAGDGADELVRDLFSERLRDFNLITISQTEDSVRAFGQGRFPQLLEV